MAGRLQKDRHSEIVEILNLIQSHENHPVCSFRPYRTHCDVASRVGFKSGFIRRRSVSQREALHETCRVFLLSRRSPLQQYRRPTNPIWFRTVGRIAQARVQAGKIYAFTFHVHSQEHETLQFFRTYCACSCRCRWDSGHS